MTNSVKFLTTISLAALIAGCANSGVLRQVFGGARPSAAVVDEAGGTFCGVMNAAGGPILLGPGDQLTRPTSERIVGINEHGEQACGWKAPNPVPGSPP